VPGKPLYDVNGDDGILKVEDDVLPEGPKWSIQMFRSITVVSALEVLDVEADCAAAYIHQIRRAQRFIYIENQYFLGGATEWLNYDDKEYNVECKHRVPIELAMRIVNKIRMGERFTVYITVPMYSEGVAEGKVLQAILFWQAETFRMMYKLVADAIAKWGPEGAHPTDYLMVFFPGNRDATSTFDISDEAKAGLTPKQQKMLETRRHMIYVHSKMAVFDDEYIIIGSANINQRSMDGARDSEIAVGCAEEGYEEADDVLPQGQVSGFRLSVWAEHLGCYDPLFLRPHDPECAAKVRAMAQANWDAYVSPELQPLPHGHLMTYPYNIQSDGGIEPVCEYFPDHEAAKASIMAARPDEMLQLLTT